MNTASFSSLRSLALGLSLATLLAPACEKTPESTSKETPAKAATTAPAKTTAVSAPGPMGSVRVISSDKAILDRPTTGTFIGKTLWVAIGQLSALFSDDSPKLPFRAVSFDLATGALGKQAVELPGPEFYPEGVASSADGTLYIGSIPQGVVFKVPAGTNRAEPFVSTKTTKRGVIGLAVDDKRKLLWLCDTNPKLKPELQGGDLVAVSLSDGKEVARHSLPKAGDKTPFCNDVIVDSTGSLWVTELIGGRIFHIAAEKALTSGPATAWITGGPLAPPDGKDCCGPNGLELVGDTLVIANSGRGTLVAVNTKGRHTAADAKIIKLTDAKTSKPMTLCSPDGLALVPGSKNKIIVVENGGCEAKAPRVIEVTLSNL